MKKTIHKRAKRVANGTTTWKVTVMNTKSGATRVKKIRGTYDEMTAKVRHIRAGNPYNAVCAEEMHKWGGKLLENGRVLALDSLEDEKMFKETITKQMRASDILAPSEDEDEQLGEL